jgi:hypothetical protein
LEPQFPSILTAPEDEVGAPDDVGLTADADVLDDALSPHVPNAPWHPVAQ